MSQGIDPGYVLLGKTGRSIGSGIPILALTNGQTGTFFDTTAQATALGTTPEHSGVKYKGLVLNIFASHNSDATTGITIDESDDEGTHWRNVYTRAYVAATDLRLKIPFFTLSAPDFRVQYKNGASTLTSFEWSLLGDRFERAV